MGFCQSFGRKIKKLLNSVDEYVHENVDRAIRITNIIKGAIDSPVLMLLTKIIPGEQDEAVRLFISNALTAALDGLILTKECGGKATLQDKLLCFVNALRELHPDVREAVLFKLASLLSKHLTGTKLSQSQIDLLVQAKYVNTKIK
jgi:hypothetical protein